MMTIWRSESSNVEDCTHCCLYHITFVKCFNSCIFILIFPHTLYNVFEVEIDSHPDLQNIFFGVRFYQMR